MKGIISHLLAFVLGVVVVILWSHTVTRDDSEKANQTQSGTSRMMSVVRSVERSGVRSKSIRPDHRPSMERDISKAISRADLDAWVESKKGHSRFHAEAMVIAGLLTHDTDLIRRGIQSDPENGHLLFVGATLPDFPDEERLAMSKRLREADPDNALSSYICAAYISEAGETGAAIQILKGAAGQPKIDDYRMVTQLMTEDALIAAGLSPDAAKIRSFFEMRAGYVSDLRTLVASLKGIEGSLIPEDASELRSMTALMGQRLRDSSKSGTIIDSLSGMALEEETLKGLPDDAPSPYDGLTVREARESIAAERESVARIVHSMPDIQEILSTRPGLAARYIEYSRVMGELEAVKWLANETKSGR